MVRSFTMCEMPAKAPPAVTPTGGDSIWRGCSCHAVVANTRQPTAAAANTTHAWPANASTAPARIGPPIAHTWKMALFQVMAFWNRSVGTSDGNRLCRVGMLKARTQPLTVSAT